MNRVNEIKYMIEKSREKLNRGLECGKSFNELYEESIELDELIETYLDLTAQS